MLFLRCFLYTLYYFKQILNNLVNFTEISFFKKSLNLQVELEEFIFEKLSIHCPIYLGVCNVFPYSFNYISFVGFISLYLIL